MTLHAKQKLLLHISVGISVGSPGDRFFANVDLLHVALHRNPPKTCWAVHISEKENQAHDLRLIVCSSLLHHNVSVMPQQCLARVSALAHT